MVPKMRKFAKMSSSPLPLPKNFMDAFRYRAIAVPTEKITSSQVPKLSDPPTKLEIVIFHEFCSDLGKEVKIDFLNAYEADAGAHSQFWQQVKDAWYADREVEDLVQIFITSDEGGLEFQTPPPKRSRSSTDTCEKDMD